MMHTNNDVDLLQMSIDNEIEAAYQQKDTDNPNYIDVLSGKARRVYDTPDKGILWGWEVTAYVMTKAIAAGAFLIPFIAVLLGYEISDTTKLWSVGISLVFLSLTGLFLVMDLDRPDRFLYVLLRPQWNSWLVKGGYNITIFGLLATIWGVTTYFNLFGIPAHEISAMASSQSFMMSRFISIPFGLTTGSRSKSRGTTVVSKTDHFSSIH